MRSCVNRTFKKIYGKFRQFTSMRCFNITSKLVISSVWMQNEITCMRRYKFRTHRHKTSNFRPIQSHWNSKFITFWCRWRIYSALSFSLKSSNSMSLGQNSCTNVNVWHKNENINKNTDICSSMLKRNDIERRNRLEVISALWSHTIYWSFETDVWMVL